MRRSSDIALYVPHGGELDTAPLFELARDLGCRIHVPVVTCYRRARMEFVYVEPGASLRPNRFGILEPDPRASRHIPIRRLDVIFLPLVGFDERGWRLGSGAGFYDRRLRHLRSGRLWRKPRLVGIAYEFQRVARLTPASWDVPLDLIVTDAGMHRPRDRYTTLELR